MSGSIIVKPLNASLSRDLDSFGKMDPYTIIKLGPQAQSTRVCKDGGQNPSWTCVCSFRRQQEQLLEFEVWDKDEFTKNDLIGQGTFAVSQLEEYGTFKGYIPLNYQGKSAGNMQVSIEFIRDGVPGQFPQGPPIQQFVSPFPNQGQQQIYVPGSAVQGYPLTQVVGGSQPQQQYQQYPGQYAQPGYPQQGQNLQQYTQYQQPNGQFPPQQQYPPQQYHQAPGQFNYPPQQGYPLQQLPPAQPVHIVNPAIQVQVMKLPADPSCRHCNGTCLIYKRHGKKKYCKHCCKKFGVCHKCAGTGWDIKRNETCRCRR